MKLQFKQVRTKEDISEVVCMADDIWREHYASIISIEQIDYMLQKYQSSQAITDQIYNENYEYYLFIQDDRSSAGYMAVKQDEDKLFLSKFYVSKNFRGKGYASQAVAFLEELCQERGLSHIWLTVNRDNTSSIAVYKKKGFRIAKEQVSDIGSGFVMDDYVMEKEILLQH